MKQSLIINRVYIITMIIGLSSALMCAMDHEMPGDPCVGSGGISETISTIMERHHGKKPLIGTNSVVDANVSSLHPELDMSALLVADDLEELRAGRALSSQQMAFNFNCLQLAEMNIFACHAMGCVGPSQFVLATTGRIRTFNKATGVLDGVLDVSLDNFFQSVRNEQYTLYPRIRYDRLSGRWFVVGLNQAAPNRILMAVSSSGYLTTTTVWNFYYFVQNAPTPTTNDACYADYVTMGIDANAIYIGANLYCAGSFNNTIGFLVRKTSVLSGGPIDAYAFRNLIDPITGRGPYAPQGVDNFDAIAQYGYFIGVDSATMGTLVLRRISNTVAGTPTISFNIFLTVPPTRAPINVPHLGNSASIVGYLDAGDDRLHTAHIRNGRLWSAHSVSVDNTGACSYSTASTRNGCRWYEIDLTTSPILLRQSGTLFMPSDQNTFDQRFYFNPSIMTTAQGAMIIGCSCAGSQEYINAAYAGRLATDPLGTLSSAVVYTQATTSYNPARDTGSGQVRRWAQYSYTSLDPFDNMTLYTIQEYCNVQDSWALQAGAILTPPPATPISANPAVVSSGKSSVDVTIIGQTINGSAFYNPPVGYRQLRASVSGTINVNKVTYLSPTSLILNLNTLNASQGLQDVSITNPDNQQRVGTGILTIN